MASILVVCTGNICRSPLAEGFLRVALSSRFGRRAPAVSSAGTFGWEGSGAMPESIAAAAERGVDVSAHVARRLKAGHVLDSDLVLTMAREHRGIVLEEAPEAVGRTFTLKELVRLLEAMPAASRQDDPGEVVLRRVAEADALRRSGFAGNPNDEDVADPIGLPLEAYRAMAWELEGLCGRLTDGIFGRAAARAATGTEGE
jgi:protein-tyrosine phosphatase